VSSSASVLIIRIVILVPLLSSGRGWRRVVTTPGRMLVTVNAMLATEFRRGEDRALSDTIRAEPDAGAPIDDGDVGRMPDDSRRAR
jgi:hypothetical protein